jgi:hypothetical protein
MTPHQSNDRGTLVIDRQFRGVGRLRRASGTKLPRELRRINDLLSDLFQRRRLDYLIAVRDGQLHPLDLLHQVEQFGMHSLAALPAPADLAPIADAWERWCARIPKANTARMYRLAWQHLRIGALLRARGDDAPSYDEAKAELARLDEAGTTPDTAKGLSLADLPEVLLRLRAAMEHLPPTFNRTRASVQAYLKQAVGTKHAAYLALEGVERLKESPRRRTGRTLARALEIRDALPAAEGRLWWWLVLHGLRVGEYFELNDVTWSEQGELLDLVGGKTDNATRVLPLLGTIPKKAVPLRRFRETLTDFGVTPHIARYTFKSFAQDAGIPEQRVEQYMGRSTRGMSGLYARVDLREWIPQDRKVLLAYIAVVEQAATEQRRGGLKRA